ncbi:MAG: hypothetical protein JEZ00_02125 [Anaerolineaceae bacterium]|nr:hypothetical protein [Anaerolineaceae bacterium]
MPDVLVRPDIPFSTTPGIQFLKDLFSTVFMVLAVAAMGLLIGVLFPKHLKKTANTIVNEPVKSGVLGLLTVSVAPIALGILAITIILAPISLILLFALGALMFYGWVAVGYEIGVRIANAMNGKWEPSILAGIGTLALSTIAAMICMIPCIGFLFYPIVIFIGLGGVFISQFGNREVKTVQTDIAPVELPENINDAENTEETSQSDKPEKEDEE